VNKRFADDLFLSAARFHLLPVFFSFSFFVAAAADNFHCIIGTD
jgi:hypothetical protein